MTERSSNKSIEVERVQTGIRIERRILKVLKATAELKDISVGDLLEGIVLHAFDGKPAFSSETLRQIGEFKNIYGLALKSTDSHNLKESKKPASR
jgi:predicted DNA-binding ribbon-helix-helix protein